MAKVNLITQAEYARRRGVSKAAVSKAVAEGRITLSDGKVDPIAADVQWARNSRARAASGHAVAPADGDAQMPLDEAADGDQATAPANSTSARAPGADDYTLARARREQADAEMATIALAERRGEVIQVRAVEIVWSQAMSGLREHLLQLRARLAPVLAAETDPFKVGEMLDLEHRAALDLMAKASYSQPGGEG